MSEDVPLAWLRQELAQRARTIEWLDGELAQRRATVQLLDGELRARRATVAALEDRLRALDHAANGRSPVLLTSVPKAGTHLLQKAYEALSGRHDAIQRLHREGVLEHVTQALPGSWGGRAPVTALQLYTPSREILERCLELADDEYLRTHLTFTPEHEEVLAAHGCRVVFVLRDPRDQLVSRVHYTYDQRAYFPGLEGLAPDELLLRLIGRDGEDHDDLLSGFLFYGGPPGDRDVSHVRELYELYLPWRTSPICLTVRFEDLVGPEGGGSAERRLAAVSAIARHCGIAATAARLQEIAGGLFGGTATFRVGSTGSWRSAFGPEHQRAFKAVAGDLLVELGYETGLDW